LLFHFICC